MQHRIVAVILSTSSAIFAACAPCASSGRSAAVPAAPAVAVQQSTVTVVAKVVRVDAKKRLVALETSDGRRMTVRAHAGVGGLESLRAGDIVRATYYESLAYDLRPPGSAAASNPVGGQAPARLPGAIDARAVTVTARVESVDASAGTLTLQAPDAESVTLRVDAPAALARVHGGDLVDITLTEAVAVAIEAAQ